MVRMLAARRGRTARSRLRRRRPAAGAKNLGDEFMFILGEALIKQVRCHDLTS
jgi:hypothetical protein